MKLLLLTLCFIVLDQVSLIQCKKITVTTPITPRTKSSAVVNGVKNSICSGMAAACAKTLLAPFDTIKTMQQQARNGGKALGMIEAVNVVVSRPNGFFELYVSMFPV